MLVGLKGWEPGRRRKRGVLQLICARGLSVFRCTHDEKSPLLTPNSCHELVEVSQVSVLGFCEDFNSLHRAVRCLILLVARSGALDRPFRFLRVLQVGYSMDPAPLLLRFVFRAAVVAGGRRRRRSPSGTLLPCARSGARPSTGGARRRGGSRQLLDVPGRLAVVSPLQSSKRGRRSRFRTREERVRRRASRRRRHMGVCVCALSGASTAGRIGAVLAGCSLVDTSCTRFAAIGVLSLRT